MLVFRSETTSRVENAGAETLESRLLILDLEDADADANAKETKKRRKKKKKKKRRIIWDSLMMIRKNPSADQRGDFTRVVPFPSQDRCSKIGHRDRYREQDAARCGTLGW